MDKNKWISRKISLLEKENKGRSHQQNVAVALNMYNQLHKAQEGYELPKAQEALNPFQYKSPFGNINFDFSKPFTPTPTTTYGANVPNLGSLPAPKNPMPTTTYNPQGRQFNFATSYNQNSLPTNPLFTQLPVNNTTPPYIPEGTVVPQTVEETTQTTTELPKVKSVFEQIPTLKPIEEDNNVKLQKLIQSQKQQTGLEPTTETSFLENQNYEIYNPYGGVGLDSALFYAGQGFGSKNYGQAAVGTGLSVLKGARGFLSGYGTGKVSQQAIENAKQQQFAKNTQSNFIAQEGGKLTNGDVLTGAYVEESDKPNLEIEHGEYMRDPKTGVIQKAIGEKHKDGGIEVNAPQGAEILSNYTKVGASKAKELSKYFDVKVKSTDTFSKVMDKVNKKIGWDDLLEEEKKYLKELEKQEKLETNKTTKELNEQFLAKEIKEIADKKAELMQEQNEKFKQLFQAQESIPKKGNGTEVLDSKGKPIEVKDKQVAQEGLKTEIPISSTHEMHFKLKAPIVKVQLGVSRPEAKKQQSGKYIYYKDPTLPGFDPKTDREFIADENWVMVEKSQEYRDYFQNRVNNVVRQEGGSNYDENVMQLSNKYGIAPERVLELMQEGGVSQEAPQEQDQMQQIMAQVIQAIQQGADPNQIAQQLLQMGIPEEQVQQVISMAMQQGQEQLPMAQEGGTPIDKFGNTTQLSQNITDAIVLGQMQGQNREYTPEEKQAIQKYYSTVVKDKDTLKVLNDRLDNNTLVFNENLLNEVQTNKDIPLQYQTETEKNLYGIQTDSRLKDYLYASDFENKFGRPFGTSPDDEALIYDEVIKTLEGEGVKYHGSPVTNKGTKLFGDVNAGKPKFVKEMQANKEYSLDASAYKKAKPEEQEAIARSLGINKADLDKEANKITTGFIKFSPPKETTPNIVETQITEQGLPAIQQQPLVDRNGRLVAPPLLPQDLLLPPSALADLYKGEVRFGELDPTKITPEPMLVEAERQRQNVSNQAYFLPDAQRASLLANTLGQTQMASNDAIGKAEMFNAQQQQQADQYNLQSQAKEDLTNLQLNSDFERRNLAGQAMYETNLRRYFNELNDQNNFNWNYIDRRNILNQGFENYKTSGSNIDFTNPTKFQNNR